MFDQSHIGNFFHHCPHRPRQIHAGRPPAGDGNAVPAREMENQILDNMDLSGSVASPSSPVPSTCFYTAQDGETYALNLIDTPGHVDFNYEVSRSLAACEGVLVVDATQGVEAQTLANTYLAMEHDLEILPVFNKIDLPAADPMKAKQEVEDIIGLPAMDAPEISAKKGINIQAVLEDIVREYPAPSGDPKAPLQALVFDSQYDPYVGVVVYFRVKQGTLRTGQTIRMMATGAEYTILECGYLKPLGNEPAMPCRPVRWATSPPASRTSRIRRWATPSPERDDPAHQPCRATARPIHGLLRHLHRGRQQVPGSAGCAGEAQLNDASLTFEPESLRGAGLRFPLRLLGMLHMEIIQERLEREFNLDLVTTLPTSSTTSISPTAPW